MTALRQRMIEDLQLRGLSTRTQDAYVRAVRMLAQHFNRSPDTLGEEELRQYFVYVHNEKHWSRSTMTQALCGIKFFYEQTLKRSWSLLQITRPGRSKQLPDVLACEEIRQLLQAVRRPLYRICLLTIYSCGLRITEGCTIQVPDIDGTRMRLHVRHSKGDKDRFVPLPHRTLESLRQLWRTHHHRVFLFPSGGDSELQLTPARHPMSPNTLEKVFRLAYRETGLTKPATVHTLRHSYATHLLEAGISLRQIQAYPGHTSLETTVRYTHLTSEAQQTAYAEINELMASL